MTLTSPPCPANPWLPSPAVAMEGCSTTARQLWMDYLSLGGLSSWPMFAAHLAAGPSPWASDGPPERDLMIQTLDEHLLDHALHYPLTRARAAAAAAGDGVDVADIAPARRHYGTEQRRSAPYGLAAPNQRR